MPDSDTSSRSDPLDLRDDEGWEDAEPDTESVQVVSLFSDRTFPDVQSMIEDCKQNHGFDFLSIQNSLELDFYETMKLINFIRREVSRGNRKLDIPSRDVFKADEYLQPTLDDDALLFQIDDLAGIKFHESVQPETQTGQSQQDQKDGTLRGSAYEDKLLAEVDREPKTAPIIRPSSEEKGYFEGYGTPGIHRTMLEDRVRTESYRDFIEKNADKIKGKVVLDVGCGTGILSMFCARAGAAKVIAVDNSSIIYKATEIVFKNGFQNVISCLHGKIEELILPVEKVDIIVSEWMGYGLLYEAMLDSVIYARNKYLRPDGLMIPSHCTLRIAAYTKPRDTFWEDIYGFDMRAMEPLDNQDERKRSVVTLPDPSQVTSDSCGFYHLPLHTIETKELTFTSDFSIEMQKEGALSGFVIWFDTFFAESRETVVSSDKKPDTWTSGSSTKVAFSTGPYATRTHWDACILRFKKAQQVNKGDKIQGQVAYKKDGERGLKIGLNWQSKELSASQDEWNLD